MAITYPINPPTTGISGVTLIARDATAATASPFTFAQQVQRNQGSRWEADISLVPMERADAESWITFLMKLYGSYGTFLIGDPNASTPRGSASSAPGTPLVNGASQTGDTLNIDGLPASATGYLKAGDYIQLGSAATSQLYKVLDDADSNASGEASLTIWPDLRSSPADNATVVVSNARGLFRLATSGTDWSISNAGFYSMSFGAVEAL
tara:strand:+ start:28 stop:654 length:627 start_codon:yes stop_codon:yes gene_type:complete